MKNNTKKLRGKLRTYLRLPLMLTLLLIAINVLVYTKDTLSGALISVFVLLYFLITLFTYAHNKPLITDALINFATQYGTVQKQLLNEFEIPYALLDYNGRYLWVNRQFT